MNYEIISQCYCEDENPFSQEIISTGIKDAMEISDFFLLNKIPKEIRKKPTFIHIDTSLTGDRTGIGGVCMLGKDRIEKFDMKSNKTIKLTYTDKKVFFATPKIYGEIKDIKDNSGFNYTKEFTRNEMAIKDVLYYVYTLEDKASVTDISFTFSY